jgi:hypothetical protein
MSSAQVWADRGRPPLSVEPKPQRSTVNQMKRTDRGLALRETMTCEKAPL